MQVILTQDVQHVGEMGEIVTVKPGYARNYLIPRKLAVVASERQQSRVEHERRAIERKVATVRAGAEELAKKFHGYAITVQKAVGENEKLFGSVTSMEIEAILKEEGFEVNRRMIEMPEVIKTTGVFEIPLKLHRDVTATLKVYVVAKAAE